jgi:hypothetical protein
MESWGQESTTYKRNLHPTIYLSDEESCLSFRRFIAISLLQVFVIPDVCLQNLRGYGCTLFEWSDKGMAGSYVVLRM